MSTLYLCGAGNPSGVRLALKMNRKDARWDRILILDDDPAKHGESILGVEIAGPFDHLREADPRTDEVANLVARTTLKRWSARHKIRAYGLPFASLVDPGVDLSGVYLASDITIYPNAIVGPGARIESSVVIFMGVAIGPWCRLGECSVLAPNAVVNSRVTISTGVYVGTNASIIPEATVGPWATVGSNSAAMFDVPARASVVGVPARVLPTAPAEVPEDSETESPVEATATR